MERKAQLIKLLENNPNKDTLEFLVEDIVFLEDKLNSLRKLPFIKVHPNDPQKQKSTPACRQYEYGLKVNLKSIKNKEWI
ncbi:MAG: hypothetical protein LIO71_01250 [Ruminococcus sp.]|nr:hypothetical protein [Ruminococcus sp.]